GLRDSRSGRLGRRPSTRRTRKERTAPHEDEESSTALRVTLTLLLLLRRGLLLLRCGSELRIHQPDFLGGDPFELAVTGFIYADSPDRDEFWHKFEAVLASMTFDATILGEKSKTLQ
ncbi:MAG: hypothetical protein KGR69_15990, partial [Verrucomicrobia bacterium]|nr:hypothetical protein [Verrucomicrobiota bacterium]